MSLGRFALGVRTDRSMHFAKTLAKKSCAATWIAIIASGPRLLPDTSGVLLYLVA
jgi:hypothetical protein